MRLKGLEGVIGTSIVHPTWQKTDPETDDHSGWAFTDPDDPPVTNQKGRRPNTLQDARGFLKRGDSTRCKDPAHILPCGAPEMIQLLHGCVLSSACSKIAGHGSFGHEGGKTLAFSFCSVKKTIEGDIFAVCSGARHRQ